MIDSGAENALTNDKFLLHNYLSNNPGFKVDASNNSLAIEGTGTTLFNFSNHFMKISAYYVPGAGKTIIVEEDIWDAIVEILTKRSHRSNHAIYQDATKSFHNLHLRFGHINAKDIINSVNKGSTIATDK
ncbi:hypothetical protein CANARDRAFT_6573 [[Candida] arabinofermentans NRRL YB-2248]|uniref:GAG-pre-integrase domain-containing protein n=1 Tax=[Candida] arabinofermentans NRRL YB-2248 TaxID=983967 RepID=A0A1E4T5I1_9ASCO|nr:hypothetical protein CANARDRAFT_6573 [[Candida] arabinofermentans NRRL YB-2248]